MRSRLARKIAAEVSYQEKGACEAQRVAHMYLACEAQRVADTRASVSSEACFARQWASRLACSEKGCRVAAAAHGPTDLAGVERQES